MVRDLERTHVALGDGTKTMYPSETEPIIKMAKKLVAARDLPPGHRRARGHRDEVARPTACRRTSSTGWSGGRCATRRPTTALTFEVLEEQLLAEVASTSVAAVGDDA